MGGCGCEVSGFAVVRVVFGGGGHWNVIIIRLFVRVLVGCVAILGGVRWGGVGGVAAAVFVGRRRCRVRRFGGGLFVFGAGRAIRRYTRDDRFNNHRTGAALGGFAAKEGAPSVKKTAVGQCPCAYRTDRKSEVIQHTFVVMLVHAHSQLVNYDSLCYKHITKSKQNDYKVYEIIVLKNAKNIQIKTTKIRPFIAHEHTELFNMII